jgi:predicted phosphodiesterase
MTVELPGVKTLIAAFLLNAVLVAGCQSEETHVPTISTPPLPSQTSTPTPGFTVTPTASQIPTATQTPIPEVDLLIPHTEISYSIPLTCQWVSDTSAILYFALDVPADGALFYGLTAEGAFSSIRQFKGNAGTHLITIDHLLPDSEYQAAVGLLSDDGYHSPNLKGAVWDPIHFRTFSLEPSQLRIGVIGDSGFGDPVTVGLVKQMADRELDFVVHTGDLVYRVEENPDAREAFLIKHYLPFAPLLHAAPLFPVPGNEDFDPPTEWEGFPYYFTAYPPLSGLGSSSPGEIRQYYAVEVGNIQILFLDTQEFWRQPDNLEQTRWLEERLKDPRFALSIPILHVPPFSSGLHSSDGVIVEREWVPLFVEYGVPLVLSGHDHNYQRIQVNGITYVVSGGGSQVLYPLSTLHPGSIRFLARSHFLILSVLADRIELEAIAATGEVIDMTEIELLNTQPYS